VTRHPMLRVALVAAGCLCAVPAHAQDEAQGEAANLGGGLSFSGAPTMQEIIAQQKACEQRKPPRKAAGAMTETTYKRMERIIDSIGKGQYAEAEQKLKEMSQKADGYEKAIVLQTLGYVYASQDREGDAIRIFEEAIGLNALPQQVHEAMMFNVAQLYVGDGKYDKGMQALNAYLQESCNPQAGAHVLLANVQTEKKQYREALKQIDLALVKTGKNVKESWLQLKLALHYELKEYARCAEVLVHLLGLAPMKQEYWKQLSGILFEIKRDPEALAALALAERRGFIDDENEIRNLSSMYMYMQIPLKAAQVLERGFSAKQLDANEKNLEALATAWLVAREYDKAETAMAKAAAASNKGELFKRLGQIQMENENWKGALDSLQKAQQKGGLKSVGETAFLAGVCAVQLKQWKTAEASLRVAMQDEKTAKMAAEWLNHLQAELAFREATEAQSDKDEAPDTKTN
jgi:tetratricopeptide (TPR) repeat protein